MTMRIAIGDDYVCATGDPEFVQWAVDSFHEVRASIATKIAEAEKQMYRDQLWMEYDKTAREIGDMKGKLTLLKTRLDHEYKSKSAAPEKK